ncbi:MAG: polysaccharide biosynthesis/export family protein [Oxalobacteraceae bacterium]|nr:polysaccharide biosynthesis/export family protein [Oxalobacteraceae bacterium]
MRTFSKALLKKMSLLALVPWLAACTTVYPGMRNDSKSIPGATPSGTAPIVKTITAQLLKSEKEQYEKQSIQNISQLQVTDRTPYKIGASDILSIVVWDHPELASAVMLGKAPAGIDGTTDALKPLPAGFVVDHDGMVQFPYAGSLKLAGLTEEQARNLLHSKLARYIKDPKITLSVQAYRSKRIYIDGEVKTPGLQAINDIPMTLVEALNRAGGLLPTADQSRIVITRTDISYPINLLQLVQKGVNPASIMLKNGDLVRVLSRDESKVFVSGEVIAPRPLTMHNGRLTLNEALGESGGINPITGDGRQVYIVRKTAKEPIVYQLDASLPGAMAMAEEFELHPKDLIYVAASPLANWNRGISLLFPGALSSAVGVAK